MGSESEKTVSFEYKISPNYATYRVTGIYGGLNPMGDIVISFFNERAAIPRMQTFKINDMGGLNESPISEEKKECLIRDVMFAVSVNIPVAREMAKWLNQKADEYEKTMKDQLERQGVVLQ